VRITVGRIDKPSISVSVEVHRTLYAIAYSISFVLQL
jgi:hypothetical protein